MTSKLLWILLAFIAGAVLPIQGGLNAKMGKAVESPVYSAMESKFPDDDDAGQYQYNPDDAPNIDGMLLSNENVKMIQKKRNGHLSCDDQSKC